MKPINRLQALSEFLRTKRSQLRPAAVGLPEGPRRRTPGLRREEVAQLAGVSTTWYTWLEQGRDITASVSVLEAVSSALRLNAEEHKYLMALALEPVKATARPPETPPSVSPSLAQILQALRHCPAVVSDRRCRIVGWNEAASLVFLNFEDVPFEQRNMIELLFARKELRSLAVNWEQFVGGFLAIFRSYYGQYVSDEWYAAFIDRMSRKYEQFGALWKHSHVDSAPEVVIEFRHAKAGKMLFELTSLQVQGANDLRCSIYTPKLGSDTDRKMKRLLDGRGASPQKSL